MVLKYVVPQYPFPTLWFGVANVIANALVSLRYDTANNRLKSASINRCQLRYPVGVSEHGG